MDQAVKIGMVVLYLGVLLGIGVVASRRVRDLRDFFAGGKNLGFVAVAFSARATGESAWLLLGLTGMGAAVGLKGMWVVLGELLGVSLAWLWMGRRFKRLTDRYDSVTMPDFLESRFRDGSHRLRIVSAVALVVFVTIYVSAQIDATGAAFETFLGWNYFVGALVGFAVVLLYSTFGGFVAVVWSDVFQGALMFLGLTALPLAALASAGGWAPVAEGLRAIDPNLLSWSGAAGWTGLHVLEVLGFVLIGFGFMGSPQIFVRFIALRDEGEIGRGAAVAIVWTILADTGAVLTGMIGRHLLTRPGQDVVEVLGNGAQNVLPRLAEATFPLIIVGLYVAIVLSAIMSTIDSLLVLAASAVVRDVHQKVRHPEMADEDLLRASRTATLTLAGVALALAMGVAVLVPERTVFWFVIFGWSGISATFCPTVILSLFWARFTQRGALAAMVGGFLAVPFFKFGAPHIAALAAPAAALSELPPALAVSFLCGILVSLLDPGGPPEGIADELRGCSHKEGPKGPSARTVASGSRAVASRRRRPRPAKGVPSVLRGRPNEEVTAQQAIRAAQQVRVMGTPSEGRLMTLPPLHGVKVLDLTRILAGPYATQILGDLGADIWKVERPGPGDDTRSWGPVERNGVAAYFLSVNRNKRSLAVDLKTSGGKALIRRLAAHADVVLENFPPGKLDALGLGFDVLRSDNPRLVMTSITAFGQEGPLSKEPGYDLVVQGYGGIMGVTGPVDGPPYRVGVPIVDLTTGLNAALGTLAALRAAERDGLGQRVDVSLFATHLGWLANVAGNALLSGEPTPRLGNAHPNVAPYEPFASADGWLLLAVGNDPMWERMLSLPDFEPLRGEERWATNNARVLDRQALADALAPIFRERPRDAWIELLRTVRVPAGPILRPDEALRHPQTAALGMLVTMQHPSAGTFEGVASPYRMSRTPVARYDAAPELGADTDAVLAEVLGLGEAELGALRGEGAIG